MKIDIKRLTETAKIPVKFHNDDACFDIYADSAPEFCEDNIVKYHTGIAISIPKGWCAKIYPRSSIYKTDFSLVNSVGIIDSGYTGEIMVVFRRIYRKDNEIHNFYQKGDRIAQICFERIIPIVFNEVDEFNKTERNINGFGSTGK